MSVEVGQKFKGKVTGITHFGAFIELPNNQSGLVHISEVSDGFIQDINTVLTVGQEVDVKVLTIAADGKISLSIRQASEQVAPAARKPFEKKRFNNEEASEPRPQFKKKFEQVPVAPRTVSTSSYSSNTNQNSNSDFDQLMSTFLKDSEDRLTSLKRNTEGKRGGRGGRRS